MCDIIHVLVATDIRHDFHVSLDNILLIGNPKYAINDKYYNISYDLPYTEIEVDIIEKLSKTSKKYLRDKANKFAFYDNLNSTIIHISSHGVFNEFNINQLNIPLNTSSILLSGYLDFIHNDKINEYGNGLITAEDIININLDTTNLVVLSLCESGSGYFDNSSSVLKGFRWALGFTGTNASVTSINEIDDMNAAIFMLLFYRNLIYLPVAKSLNKAKIQMRQLTVYDIKSDTTLNSTFGSVFSNLLNDDKPFTKIEHWNMFECYFYGGVLK